MLRNMNDQMVDGFPGPEQKGIVRGAQGQRPHEERSLLSIS